MYFGSKYIKCDNKSDMQKQNVRTSYKIVDTHSVCKNELFLKLILNILN